MAGRNVEYGLSVHEDIPEPHRVSSQPSPLESQLDAVVSNPSFHAPKWVLIGKYASAVSATAAASTLRGRHGDTPSVEGWRFETRRIDNGEATGLFTQYNEDAIVDGARAEFDRKRKERNDKLTAARRERAAAREAQTV